jgi:hypothetical protein
MIELTLPEFDVDGKSTKDLVIMLLLKNHPMSVKQLWYRVNRTFGRNISYQGVYKTIATLLAAEILKKGEIGYEINLEWIRKVRKFTQVLESTYDGDGLPIVAVS